MASRWPERMERPVQRTVTKANDGGDVAARAASAPHSLATPSGKPKGLATALTWRRLPAWAARAGIALATARGRPFRIGSTVVAARHADVMEALARDLDFRIQPVFAPRFDPIGYHFILGMDRSSELVAERRVLYAALARVDHDALRTAAQADAEERLNSAGPGPFDLVGVYARPIAGATASRLFGIGREGGEDFLDAVRAVFGNSFLNPGGDAGMTDRAYAAANRLSEWFEAEIARRIQSGQFGDDMMGRLLEGGASPDLARRTLGGMLVGSIDTTATCVAKVMAVLMDDDALRRRAVADVDDLARMRGWCDEALRRWPHGPLLVRKAARDTELAGTLVKAGDTVMLWTQAAMLDPAVFPAPHDLRSDRPGGAYLHSGGGLHPCAGRGINAWQIPLLVAALLRCRPIATGAVEWAGPFPAHLPIHFAPGKLEGTPR